MDHFQPANPSHSPTTSWRIYKAWFRYVDRVSMQNTTGSRVQFWSLAARLASFKVQKLAKDSQLHIRQIERRCREELGRNPREWLIEQKMVAARSLLRETESVKKVAIELDYKQLSHFCRQFKDFYGITPSEYLLRYHQLNGNVAFR